MSAWPFGERAAVVAEAESRCRLPAVVGSGVTPENVAEFYADVPDGRAPGSFKSGANGVAGGRHQNPQALKNFPPPKESKCFCAACPTFS